jgi:hypothetical protein
LAEELELLRSGIHVGGSVLRFQLGTRPVDVVRSPLLKLVNPVMDLNPTGPRSQFTVAAMTLVLRELVTGESSRMLRAFVRWSAAVRR